MQQRAGEGRGNGFGWHVASSCCISACPNFGAPAVTIAADGWVGGVADQPEPVFFLLNHHQQVYARCLSKGILVAVVCEVFLRGKSIVDVSVWFACGTSLQSRWWSTCGVCLQSVADSC